MYRQLATPAAVGGAVVVALLSLTLLAGPLDPPSGPVAPTYKTLAEVEPRTAISATNTPGDADSLYRITQRGSYYLTGNIAGASGKHGIEVAIDGVTIDLMGFSMIGGAGSLDGITTDGVRGLITIRNGVIGGWGDDGIDLSPTGSGEGSLVENIVASGNSMSGIVCANLAVVRSCEVTSTLGADGDGIRTGSHSVVEGCAAHNNSGTGIFVDTGSSVIDSVASFNGVDGIRAYYDCVVRGCAARENLDDGIETGQGSSIEGCAANANGAMGIHGGENNTIVGCAAGHNGSMGLFAQQGSTITDCSAVNNSDSGIYASVGSVVERCSARRNGTHGIALSGLGVARGNACSNNGISSPGGAGIHATNFESRIEGNNCVENDFGILVEGSVNLVFGNSCRSNGAGNYSIVSGNRVGVIVVPPVSGQVSGNSGAAGFGSTDPWANIAY
jgi:parallel beta-helix repeat protein